MHRIGPAAFVRIQRIHETLRHGGACTCASLARLIEIHPRTIRRDLDLLRDQLHAPLEYDPSAKSWRYTRPYDLLGTATIATHEALALLLAEQSFGGPDGSPIATALHAVFEKIAETAGENVRHSWESLARAVAVKESTGEASARERLHFPVILDAINQRRELALDYAKPTEARPRRRRVHPLALAELDRRWVAVAWDPEAGAPRKFLLARMETCRPLESRFDPPAGFDLKPYLAGSVGLFTGETDYRVEVEFDARAAGFLRENPWHVSQTLTDLPGGGVRAVFTVNNLLDIRRLILTWDRHATVKAPPELVAEFAAIAKDFSKKYQKTSDGGHPVSGVPC